MLEDIKRSKVPVLISFPLCPFVQRSAILLEQKGQQYTRINIDLSNKPDWFLELSPTGKVPVLVVNNDDQSSTVLFESAVINEYLDERYGEPLLTGNALQKAHKRAWISYSEGLIVQQYQLMLEKDQNAFEAKLDAFYKALVKMVPRQGGGYFDGDTFSLVDAAVAPVFTRLKWLPHVLHKLENAEELDSDKKESRRFLDWIHRLQNLAAVQNSVPQDFELQFEKYFKNEKSAALA